MHFKEVSDPDVKAAIKKITGEIEDFVEWIFQHHEDSSRPVSKVIHDAVWGTHRYEDFEIALINSPLIQRLRHIHQTAYTYLTYPSTQHTRFEHTLGVTAQVGNLFKALHERFKHASSSKERLLDDGLYRTLRVAAILHDSAHGALSHTSEEIYGKYEEIRLLKKYDPFKNAGPAEILTYLLLDTDGFKEFLRKIKERYNISIDENLMKNAIVGYAADPSDRYKVDILNGPFDADKLDYLFRDGHFSGLPLQIDLDRLWYSININKVNEHQRLTIDWSGVSSLEQIVFSKMMLYPAIYHHHKVRACDCMLKGVIEYIRDEIKEDSMKLSKEVKSERLSIDFKRATHFLYFTDPEIFGMHGLVRKDDNLHKLMHNLQYRRLLKRAIVISRDTVKEEVKIDDYIKYREKAFIKEDGLEYYRWLAKRIWEEAGTPGLLQEIWVDCPRDPSFEEANDTWISPLGEGHDPMPLTKFFQTEQYANQYKQKKWRSHVFCRPEDVTQVSRACVSVFKKEFDIEFEPLAFHLCHIDVPSNP